MRGLGPPGPERSQRSPEQLVHGSPSTARSLGVQNQQLLMKSQVFKDEVLPGTENTDQPAEEMSERRDYSRNHIRKVRIQLCAKSFILQVYGVLAGHTHVCRDIRALVAFATARVKPGSHARKFGLDSGEVDGMMGWLPARKE